MSKTEPVILIDERAPGFGGSVTSLAALIPELKKVGFRVEIATPQRIGWEHQGFDPLPHFTRAETSEARHYWAFLFSIYRRSRELKKIAKKLSPDLILANNTPSANMASYWTGRSLGIPVVQYVRERFYPDRAAKWALNRAKAVFTVGDDIHRLVSTIAPDIAAVQIDEGLSRQQWPAPRQKDAYGWFWASALARWKGLPFLLEAYSKVREARKDIKKFPDLTVCYVRMPSHAAAADEVPPEMPAGVRLLSNPPDLQALRSAASVYLHSALVPEPFGRSILEAMAAGLCPIVPNEGGAAHLVTHMKTGIQYEARSEESLAAAMNLVLDNPQLALRFGNAAAEAATAFRSDIVFKPVVDTLLQLTQPRT
ncbi:MAG: glycosyltransferase family 4 protein [Myxococcota bacterium]|nr:glycosyltransferase family 4 protein [Myxococcota bacterium]